METETKPDISPQTIAKPVARLGFTAAWIHGLGVLCLIVAVLLRVYLPADTDEQYAGMVISGTAAVILALWSVVLTVRAMLRQERVGWPLAVCLAFLLELGAFFSVFWLILDRNPRDLPGIVWVILWLGLPLFVPFFALMSLFTAPISFWQMRRMERKAAEPQTRRSALKYFLRRFALLSALFSCVFLPMPLFLYSALSPLQFDYYYETVHEGHFWATFVSRNMPAVIADATESIVSHADSQIAEFAQSRILIVGHVSKERIEERAYDIKYDVIQNAWKRLENDYPETALNCARDIVFNNKPARRESEDAALKLIALKGSDADRAAIFQSVERFNGWSQLNYFNNLPKGTFEKELTALAKGTSRARVFAMRGLLRADSKIIEDVWLTCAGDSDVNLRRSAAYLIGGITDEKTRVEVALVYSKDADPEVRKSAASRVGSIDRRWLQRAIELLDDSDSEVRQSAFLDLRSVVGSPSLKATPEAISKIRVDIEEWLRKTSAEANPKRWIQRHAP